ncbi:MAG: hypothetical protein WAN59_08175 [Candidatus Baltobacteraceae bacterium]|jgi:hypothetical protein
MRRRVALGAAAAWFACALGADVPSARAAASPSAQASAQPGARTTASPGVRATASPGARATPAPDWGPSADVAAIREIELGIDQQLMDPQASVTVVTVARGYALVGWKTTQGAGQSLYCRTSLGWNRIATGGAPFDVAGLVGSGVPSQAVDLLRAHLPGGLAASSGMGATRYRRLTGRCL